ncbi:MAG: hypothetical protein NZM06_08090 [Chloroherpetonaceae bacterium]|nr:hypothetical protein [Chloroherpetonaceae bacterium]MDW8437708.1 hypothetical protein [Chloroherpetonaceae bacterium]
MLWLLVALAACGKEVELDKDDERFAALYAETLLVQIDSDRLAAKGVAYSKLDTLKKLFALRQTTAERFRAALDRYASEPERWLKVQERALALLSKWRDQETLIPEPRAD